MLPQPNPVLFFCLNDHPDFNPDPSETFSPRRTQQSTYANLIPPNITPATMDTLRGGVGASGKVAKDRGRRGRLKTSPGETVGQSCDQVCSAKASVACCARGAHGDAKLSYDSVWVRRVAQSDDSGRELCWSAERHAQSVDSSEYVP